MVLAPLLAAPTLMLLASCRRAPPRARPRRASSRPRRSRSRSSSWPLGADGPAVAASAGAHVVAQVAFALAFAAVIVRRGALRGLAAAALRLRRGLAGGQLALARHRCGARDRPRRSRAPARREAKGPGPLASGAPVDARVGAVVVFGVVGAALVVADGVGAGAGGDRGRVPGAERRRSRCCWRGRAGSGGGRVRARRARRRAARLPRVLRHRGRRRARSCWGIVGGVAMNCGARAASEPVCHFPRSSLSRSGVTRTPR